jgi:hypothetical protein
VNQNKNENNALIIAVMAIIVIILLCLMIVPGLIASSLPHTPPSSIATCKEEYPTHIELSGDEWLDEPVNGAQCFHVWPTVHYCKSNGLHFIRFAVCTCI